MNWISVKDALPDTLRIVLVQYTAEGLNYYSVGGFYNGRWYVQGQRYCIVLQWCEIETDQDA